LGGRFCAERNIAASYRARCLTRKGTTTAFRSRKTASQRAWNRAADRDRAENPVSVKEHRYAGLVVSLTWS
jgi:hypothetical protein